MIPRSRPKMEWGSFLVRLITQIHKLLSCRYTKYNKPLSFIGWGLVYLYALTYTKKEADLAGQPLSTKHITSLPATH